VRRTVRIHFAGARGTRIDCYPCCRSLPLRTHIRELLLAVLGRDHIPLGVQFAMARAGDSPTSSLIYGYPVIRQSINPMPVVPFTIWTYGRASVPSPAL